MRRLLLLVAVSLFSLKGWAEFDHSFKGWDQFLKKHVSVTADKTKSAVDYKKIEKKEIAKITQKMLKVERKTVDSWTSQQRMAYYINLYNSLTIQYIMAKYPKYKSIKKYRFWGSPWKEKFFTLFGEKTNLDTIEHVKIRGAKGYSEPRIHFAVNCASIGCPALSGEAYVAERLEEQLQAAMVNFLKDHSRNFYDVKSKTLRMSKIIVDWYKQDFSKGYLGYTSVKVFAQKNAKHLARNPEEEKAILSGKYTIDDTDYDWNLNDVH